MDKDGRGTPTPSGATAVPHPCWGTGGNLALAVKSATDQAADLQARINTLYAAGVLNRGQAKSLSAKLRVSDTESGTGKVQSFLKQVQGWLREGILTQAEAGVLVDLGNLLLISVRRR